MPTLGIQITRTPRPFPRSRISRETVYAVTDLTYDNSTAAELADAIRGHWSVHPTSDIDQFAGNLFPLHRVVIYTLKVPYKDPQSPENQHGATDADKKFDKGRMGAISQTVCEHAEQNHKNAEEKTPL
jgi:hypothetical protein